MESDPKFARSRSDPEFLRASMDPNSIPENYCFAGLEPVILGGLV
jgi:hypothetical protein